MTFCEFVNSATCQTRFSPLPHLCAFDSSPVCVRDGGAISHCISGWYPLTSFSMKIAFMHFHLKTGGVTTVIRQQVEALLGTCETIALAGQKPEGGFPCKVLPVSGIGYDSEAKKQPSPDKTAEAVIQAIRSCWKGGCDILHVHNGTLAKNQNYLAILKRLQEKGVRLFLQAHDFAEDGRPQAYFEEEYVPDCHYGVVNSRDYHILRRSGLKREGLHLIGNMVTPLPAQAKKPVPGGPVLYPIRAIRRKNIGEAILLSLFFPEGRPLYITLPPNSPADFPAYESWKRFAHQHGLSVVFEAGLKHDFVELVHTADSLLTTSINEGFGFSFMEPWTAGKFLWGRDIEGITEDFKQSGLNLDHLYSRIRISLEWIRADRFFRSWQHAVNRAFQGFQISPEDLPLREACERLTTGGTVDFGLLDETFQQQVVQTIIGSEERKADMINLNPFLADCGRYPNVAETINANREVVTGCYSRTAYRSTLSVLYKKILSSDPVHAIDKRRLLKEFFNRDDFSLLKWGQYAS